MGRPRKERTAGPVERVLDQTENASPSRVTLKLDSKGAPAWDEMSQDSKDLLIAAFEKDPDAARVLFPSVFSESTITPNQIKPALDIFSMLAVVSVQALAVKKFHHPLDPDIAGKIPLTEEQKNDIAPPAARAANQYVPDAAKKHVDLGLAISGLFAAFSANISMAMTTQAVRDFQQKHQQKGNGKAPQFIPDVDRPPQAEVQPV